MSAVKKYLSRQQLYSENIWAPEQALKMVVVIPCFMEPDITTSLLSLWENKPVSCGIEVIVVVNSSELATREQVEFNRNTYQQLQQFATEYKRDGFVFIPLLIAGTRRKHAGVGMARKTGMDLALQRFLQVEESNGVLISLDADSIVSSNYLSEIYRFYQKQPKATGAILSFEHIMGNASNKEEVYLATMQYELYLRYFRQALNFTKFPYAFHTIGSCFTITAEAYARVGGMPRKQAGEDFYLLHKLFPMGFFGEITTAKVYPAARESDRVPFGTGPMVSRILQNDNQFTTYSFELFVEIKKFFLGWDMLYENPNISIEALGLEKRLIQFLKAQNFDEDLIRVRQNSASKKAFLKQLFAVFNAFKIIQYLNENSASELEKGDVLTESAKLLNVLGYDVKENSLFVVLNLFRQIDEGHLNSDS